MLTYKTTAKESCAKKFRPIETKSDNGKVFALLRINVAKSLEQDKKDKIDKKQRFWKYQQDYIGEQKKQTLATSVNITEADSKKKYSDITYYNCDKKSYYLKCYLEPPKN